MTRLGISIGRRLSLLVLSELLVGLLVALTGVLALERVRENAAYQHHYVFKPLVETGQAFVHVDELRMLREVPPPDLVARASEVVAELRAFLERYNRTWQVAKENTPEARRFQALLADAGRTDLLGQESEAVNALRRVIEELERTTGQATPGTPPGKVLGNFTLLDLRHALTDLNTVNLQYVDIANARSDSDAARTMLLLIIVGLLALLAGPVLGLRVRHAIVPRIQLLVEKVKRFRELGVNEPLGDWGGDELAVLAKALDASFTAIAERDADRERFLAVAAHELKTPLTTIKGYAQAALGHPDNPVLLRRALTIIDAQSSRLARLSQDLLWTARAQGGHLPFHPAQLDLAALARQVVASMKGVAAGRALQVHARGETTVQGDEALLEHLLWGMVSFAITLSPPAFAVVLAIEGDASRVRLTLRVPADASLPTELERLLEPFGAAHFEGVGELRGTGVGMHLGRAIARIHGALLQLRREGSDVVLSLEFRRGER